MRNLLLAQAELDSERLCGIRSARDERRIWVVVHILLRTDADPATNRHGRRWSLPRGVAEDGHAHGRPRRDARREVRSHRIALRVVCGATVPQHGEREAARHEACHPELLVTPRAQLERQLLQRGRKRFRDDVAAIWVAGGTRNAAGAMHRTSVGRRLVKSRAGEADGIGNVVRAQRSDQAHWWRRRSGLRSLRVLSSARGCEARQVLFGLIHPHMHVHALRARVQIRGQRELVMRHVGQIAEMQDAHLELLGQRGHIPRRAHGARRAQAAWLPLELDQALGGRVHAPERHRPRREEVLIAWAHLLEGAQRRERRHVHHEPLCLRRDGGMLGECRGHAQLGDPHVMARELWALKAVAGAVDVGVAWVRRIRNRAALLPGVKIGRVGGVARGLLALKQLLGTEWRLASSA